MITYIAQDAGGAQPQKPSASARLKNPFTLSGQLRYNGKSLMASWGKVFKLMVRAGSSGAGGEEEGRDLRSGSPRPGCMPAGKVREGGKQTIKVGELRVHAGLLVGWSQGHGAQAQGARRLVFLGSR